MYTIVFLHSFVKHVPSIMDVKSGTMYHDQFLCLFEMYARAYGWVVEGGVKRGNST